MFRTKLLKALKEAEEPILLDKFGEDVPTFTLSKGSYEAGNMKQVFCEGPFSDGTYRMTQMDNDGKRGEVTFESEERFNLMVNKLKNDYGFIDKGYESDYDEFDPAA